MLILLALDMNICSFAKIVQNKKVIFLCLKHPLDYKYSKGVLLLTEEQIIMLKEILKIAAGVALGNKISQEVNNRKNEKKDFMGTDGCVYGKKNSNGWTQHCHNCPIKRYCTRA